MLQLYIIRWTQVTAGKRSQQDMYVAVTSPSCILRGLTEEQLANLERIDRVGEVSIINEED